jgi:hypothetical protein
MSPPSSGSKNNKPRKKLAGKQGKQSNQLARISGYIGNRREVEEWNSVPIGSPVGQSIISVLNFSI